MRNRTAVAGVWSPMRLAVAAAVALLTAWCASPTPSPSGSVAPPSIASASASPRVATAKMVVVRQEALTGSGFYTEGGYAFVEIRAADGALISSAQTDRYHLAQDLIRIQLSLGTYSVVSFVRPCEAACPAMDLPTDSCEGAIDVEDSALLVTIARAIGRPCAVNIVGT